MLIVFIDMERRVLPGIVWGEIINMKWKTGAPCYLTKFWDSCRHNSFAYAANGRCPRRLFGMQFFASLARC